MLAYGAKYISKFMMKIVQFCKYGKTNSLYPLHWDEKNWKIVDILLFVFWNQVSCSLRQRSWFLYIAKDDLERLSILFSTPRCWDPGVCYYRGFSECIKWVNTMICALHLNLWYKKWNDNIMSLVLGGRFLGACFSKILKNCIYVILCG